MIDLNFRMSRTTNRHGGYTDLENGAFQETSHLKWTNDGPRLEWTRTNDGVQEGIEDWVEMKRHE